MRFCKHSSLIMILGFTMVAVFLSGHILLPPCKAPYCQFVDAQGNVSDLIVYCLGLTGIRIEEDPLKPDSAWPEPKLVLKSRNLQEVTNAVQGRTDSNVSWKMNSKRWEMFNSLLSPLTANKIIQLGAKGFKFNDAIFPKVKKYEGVLLLGSTARSFYERLLFANSLAEKKRDLTIQNVYILTGKRSLESFEKEEFPFLKNIQDEGRMSLALFKKYANAKLKQNLIYVYSDIPPGETRATTESTVHTFMKKKPKPGRYLAISNGYYIPYQELIIQNCIDKFYPNSGIQIEGVGSADKASREVMNDKEIINKASILLDNLSRILYNLQIRNEVKD